jgi:hypothetical protein
MPEKSTKREAADDLGAKPGERLFTSLVDLHYAAMWGEVRRMAPLPDSELLRQAMIRLHEELKHRGGLVIKTVPDSVLGSAAEAA